MRCDLRSWSPRCHEAYRKKTFGGYRTLSWDAFRWMRLGTLFLNIFSISANRLLERSCEWLSVCLVALFLCVKPTDHKASCNRLETAEGRSSGGSVYRRSFALPKRANTMLSILWKSRRRKFARKENWLTDTIVLSTTKAFTTVGSPCTLYVFRIEQVGKFKYLSSVVQLNKVSSSTEIKNSISKAAMAFAPLTWFLSKSHNVSLTKNWECLDPLWCQQVLRHA